MYDGKWWYRTYVMVAEIKILHPTFFYKYGFLKINYSSYEIFLLLFSKNEQSVGFDISYLTKLSNTKDRWEGFRGVWKTGAKRIYDHFKKRSYFPKLSK